MTNDLERTLRELPAGCRDVVARLRASAEVSPRVVAVGRWRPVPLATAAALAARSERAVADVIARYSRHLYTVAAAALRGVGTEQDAEEAAADAFVYLWEHPEKFDPRRGSLKTWLSIVARSRALDRSREILRCRAVSLEEIELADPLGVPEALLAGERRAALNAAVDALAEPDREILLRRYYFGQKPREIAAALGLDKKQVDNRLYQTKRRLRASVTGAEGE